MDNLFEQIASICNPYSYPRLELLSLYIKINGRTKRIMEGDDIRVENEKIISLESPTHRITGIWGRVGDIDIVVHLIDLKTKELSTLKIN